MLNDRLSEEDGSTLLEVIVSASLLIGVLVPTAAFLASSLPGAFAGDRVQAGIRAERQMEEAIAHPDARDTTFVHAGSRFVVIRRITRGTEFTEIKVTIARKKDSTAVATLATIRPLPEADEGSP